MHQTYRYLSITILGLLLINLVAIAQTSPTLSVAPGQSSTICQGSQTILTASGSTASNSGQMLQFNSATSGQNYVQLPSNLTASFTSGFTFEAWVNPAAVTTWTRILNLGSSTSNSIEIILNNGGSGRIGFQSALGTTVSYTSTYTPVANTWFHLAVTMDGTNLIMYANGNAVLTQALTRRPIDLATSTANYLGRSIYNGDPAFLGTMDEIRFWNTTRTSTQINADMRRSVSPTSSGLVAYYRLDNTTGTTTADATTNANDGTLFNFGGTVWANSTVSSFTTNNISYSWSPSASVTPSTGATVAAAPTTNTTYTVTPIDPLGNSGTTSNISVTVSNNQALTISYSSLSSCGGTVALTASGNGPWNWSNGATTQTIQAAVSGAYTVTTGSCTSLPVSVSVLASPVLAPSIAATSSTICNGSSTVLSASNTDASAGNMLNFSSNVGGQNYINLPTGLTPTMTSGFTYEAWINPASNPTWNAIFSLGSNTGSNFEIRLNYSGTNRIGVVQYGGTGVNSAIPTSPQVSGLATGNTIQLNQWIHVAVTLDGTNMNMYINGNLAWVQATSFLPSVLGNTTNNMIGRTQWGNQDNAYNGLMDEVRVWSVARTQSQIQAYLNNYLPASNTGLQLYYKFDNNATATTVQDYSGRGNTGTMVNFSGTTYTTSTITGFNPYIYTWTPTSSLTSNTGASVSAFPSSTTTYTVTATNSNTQCFNTQNVTITVNNTPTINTQPINVNTCTNSNTSFSVVATGSNALTYNWQVSLNNGATWSNVSGGTYSGAATSSLALTSTPSNFNGNLYRCQVSSCSTTVTSNVVTLLVSNSVAPTIAISSNQGNTVCNSTYITFSAAITNGGASPTYQWKLNGTNVATGNTYTTSSLVNNDLVTCVLTSNLACASTATATSNSISMTVTGSLSASISISASAATICPSSSTTFTANVTNGGASPTYQWLKNGATISGATSATYTTSSLAASDSITCRLTSSLSCVIAATVTSNKLYVSALGNNASVSITNNLGSGNTCSGPVVFTATPTNGGVSPIYQWRKNNIVVGTNSATYNDAGLSTGDVITVRMTPSTTCGVAVVSNAFNVTTNSYAPNAPTITPSSSTNLCVGSNVSLVASNADAGSGNMLAFNSATAGQNYLQLPNNINNTMTSGFTYEGWILPISNPTWNCFFSMGSSQSNNFEIRLNYNGTSRIGFAHYYAGNNLSVTMPTSPQVSGLGTGNVVLSQWTHVAVTMDGTNINLYINGNLAYTYASTFLPSLLGATTNNSIGRTQWVDPAYNGYMDEVKVWNIARTQSQIQASMNNNQLVNSSGLLAYYKFDETSGTTAFDASPNGRNATLVNFTGNIWNTSNLASFNQMTYAWSPATGLTGTTGAAVTASPSGTTTYTVTATNSLGCANSKTVTVTVNNPVSITTQPVNTTACINTNANFSVITVGGNTVTYLWQYTINNGASWLNARSASFSNDSTATLTVNNLISGMSGYKFRCQITACGTTITSNVAQLTVNSIVNPTISISSNLGTSICSGTGVTFTANVTNAGSNPTYQWKINGTNALGGGTNLYFSSTLGNNDVITCVVTSSSACASVPTATSNSLTMSIAGSLTPAVTIYSSSATICPSSYVTFTTVIANGGTTPFYQWKMNGANVSGQTASSFSTFTLNAGDVVSCALTSSFTCASASTVNSNNLTVATSVNNASVSITNNLGTGNACGGPVTFTATPVNGGGSPSYQWRKNNVVVGSNSSTYISSSLTVGDVITVQLTPSTTCGTAVVSNNFTITTSSYAPLAPAVTAAGGSSSICRNSSVTLTASNTDAGAANMLNFPSNTALQNYLQLPNNITANMTSGFTYEGWIRPTSNLQWNAIFSLGSNTGSNFEIRLNYGGTNRIGIAQYGGTGSTVTMPASPQVAGLGAGNTVQLNQWMHVAVTLDGTNLNMYINGNLAWTFATAFLPNALGTTSNNTIGRTQWTNDPAYNGFMDEVKVWSSVRTQSQIQSGMYNTALVNTPSLVCYYKFDETSGTTAFDASPNANNATLISFTGSIWNASTISGFNTFTYSWSPSTGLSSTTGANVSAAPQITTIYTVTASNSVGCSNTNTVLVTVNTPQVITSQPTDASVCINAATSFTVVASGGNNLTYNWQFSINNGSTWNNVSGGIYSGANSATLNISSAGLNMNGYKYRCLVSGCTSTINTTAALLAVSDILTPSISVVSSQPSSICQGTTVIFTATAVNAGNFPVYQWKINGVNVGGNSNLYLSDTLRDNDVVVCQLTSNSPCASVATVSSDNFVMDVVGNVAPTISITASSATVCPSSVATFTATTTGSGANPSYQWMLNGSNISGATASIYTTISLSVADVITCRVTSELSCSSPSSVVSNSITVNTFPVDATVSISNNFGSGNACSGPVTFTATVSGASANPSFQWVKNNNYVGTNSITYVDAALNSGDVISVRVTPSITCGRIVTSNLFNINQVSYAPLVPIITSNNTNNICRGTTVNLTSSNIDAGGGNMLNFASSSAGQNYLTLPNNLNSTMTTGFTFESWIRPTSNVNYNAVFSLGSSTNYNFELRLNFNGTNRIGFSQVVNGTSNSPTMPTTPQVSGLGSGNTVQLNTWMHIAVTLDGTTQRVYINGNLAWSYANTFLPNALGLTTNNLIGRTQWGNGDPAYNGFMDEVKFWAVARTQAQIQTAMNNAVVVNTPQLVAYYKMNEASGTTTADASPNANNATLVNFTGSIWNTSTISGFNTYTYSWSPNRWISATSGNTVNVTPDSTTTYTVTVSNTIGCLNVQTYIVNVNKPATITSASGNISNCATGTANYTVAATGISLTYRWQFSTNSGTTFVNLSDTGRYTGSTSASLNVANVTSAQNNYQFRCMVTGVCGTAVYSTPASLTVSGNPTISANPASTSTCANTFAMFRAAATGSNAFSYQWQQSTNSGSTWANLSDAGSILGSTKDTLSIIAATSAMNGYQFRCVISGCSQSLTTNASTLSILATGTWIGASNSWTSSSNWCGGVPTASTDVNIMTTAPNQPNIISGTARCKNLTVPANTTLNIAPNSILQVYGAINTSGAIVADASSRLELLGTTAQSLGSATLGELKVNNASGVTLTGTVQIANRVTLTNGIINAVSNPVIFGTSATTPTETSTSYIYGRAIAKGRTVGTGAYSMLGVGISSGVDNLDTVYIERNNVTSASKGSFNGINSVWTISPGRQPSAGTRNVTLTWLSTADNGKNLVQAQVWKREKGAIQWIAASGIVNATTRTVTVTTSSFSDWTVSDASNPLPVEFSSISASYVESKATVKWSTATELNAAHFIVERSMDGGKTYEAIGTVQASGNSNTSKHYTLVDKNLMAVQTTVFYRVKQVDFDGKFIYSPIARLAAKGADISTTLYPNPAQNHFYISTTGLVNNMKLSLRNTNGVEVMSQEVMNGELVNISTLPAGIYYYSISNDEQLKQGKVVISK